MADLHKLLKWYNGLSCRTLDLIGDYAGNELFLIEGDSLLLHCFSDDQLDLPVGFQLLHAVHIVERLLAQLHQRKCRFHIVFFSSHSHTCIPPKTDKQIWRKYLLAREAIIQHLEQFLPSSTPSIQVRRFDAYNCEMFETYLASVGAYFIMCHDGAFVEASQSGKRSRRIPQNLDGLELSSESETEPAISDSSTDCSTSVSSTSIVLRSMIHWSICNGYNVSLINTLDCHDTKVFSVIIEGSIEQARQLFQSQNPEDSSNPLTSISDVERTSKLRNSLVFANFEIQSSNPYSYEKIQLFGNQAQTKLSEIISHSTPTDLTQCEYILLLSFSAIMEAWPTKANVTAAQAVLIHLLILRDCKLSERASIPTSSPSGEIFLEHVIDIASVVLESSHWKQLVRENMLICDLADLIDGRLFLTILEALKCHGLQNTWDPSSLSKFEILAALLAELCGVDVGKVDSESGKCDRKSGCPAGSRPNPATKNLLSFYNPVLDPHFSPISLAVEQANDKGVVLSESKVFRELSHWHNHKHLMNARSIDNMTEWQRLKANRRNQYFMAGMRDYTMSLTGGILEPQTVTVSAKKQQRRPNRIQNTSSTGTSSDKPGKKLQPENLTHLKTTISVKDQIAAQIQGKNNEFVNKQVRLWKFKCDELERKEDLTARYLEAKKYLTVLRTPKKKTVVEVEILTYAISTLVQLWIQRCSAHMKQDSMHVAVLIWDSVLQIAKAKQGVTENVATCIESTVDALKLPFLKLSRKGKEKLSFRFASLPSSTTALELGLSPVEFQLLHAGPYLERSMGSAPDARVDFEPDKWQRQVLDLIDARKSLFVLAPTSAGKTFISFYAMRQILEDSDDEVLVYVAPTKALVNQIAAEVMARFSKEYKRPGKSLWAIHTRDYRINNPAGCQVLITVPHILQIMLLAPSHAASWSSRVLRIIFDEIHCIGQADDGVVWEQLLLLAPCPIIALSATVGNPEEFSKWLRITQKANGNELVMVEHKARWSDIRKYIYRPPHSFLFNGFSNSRRLNGIGLDGSPNMAFLHPVTSLVDNSRGIPDDLSLEPRDCWMLWRAIDKHQTVDFPLNKSLNPSVALPSIVAKTNIIQWESKLKIVLKRWISQKDSPFDAVMVELSSSQPQEYAPEQISFGRLGNSEAQREVKRNSLLNTTLPLICSLHDQEALPALIFNYDRNSCERLCQQVLNELQHTEERWKNNSTEWTNLKAKWKAWKENEGRSSKARQTKKVNKGVRDGKNMSKEEQVREAASAEPSLFTSFDPDALISRFSLADGRKALPSELDVYKNELRNHAVHDWLISALKRGVGVHHSGMNRKYRQICEMLFRKGFLQVVFATGTLALGINMPCKTVVFAGDSLFLMALGFRQAAGRAGRRGFDVLGNVVFQGLSRAKVCRLLSSKLPDLNGHFPITTSLVLRLLILLHESDQAPFAVKAINSILSCPRIYLGGPESRHTVLHHLRFSIEYLRRNQLLSPTGAPLNFAGTISHLYYTENSSFAFHALLSGGYFHHLCKAVHTKPDYVLRTLILVMAHLFGRQPLRRSVLEAGEIMERDSPSVVILPPLPERATSILQCHNDKTLDIYSTYVATFIEQHGCTTASDIMTPLNLLPPAKVNSAFVALSGHCDKWNSIADLCKKVRNGVWLEQSVVPYVGVSPEDTVPLNAYLYDFFKHGDVRALHSANMIRKGDIWFLLNDFSLVLATIVTSFENFFKLSSSDEDMLAAMGSGEAYENMLDDQAIGDGPVPNTPKRNDEKILGPLQASGSSSLPSMKTKKKAQVVDSWEDELSDECAHSEATAAGILPDHMVDSKGKTPISNINNSEDQSMSSNAAKGLDEGGLRDILEAFKLLQWQFNEKFRAMWA